MTELRTAIVRNLDTDVTTVRANGVLDLRTAAEMRAVLLKVISECPSAVVIDVSDCAVAHPAALAVFAAAMRHHAWQPVVAVFRDLLKTSAVAVAARSRPVERPAMGSVNRPSAAARRPKQMRR